MQMKSLDMGPSVSRVLCRSGLFLDTCSLISKPLRRGVKNAQQGSIRPEPGYNCKGIYWIDPLIYTS